MSLVIYFRVAHITSLSVASYSEIIAGVEYPFKPQHAMVTSGKTSGQGLD